MDLDAFILIGGRSSRLGTDKAFVELGGKTLAELAANTIDAALKPQHIAFVAASDTQFRDRIPFALDHPVITDLMPGFGAWSGLHAALAYARTEWALVMACDLPFLSAEYLKRLAALIDDEHDAVLSIQPNGQAQPLCALYRVRPVLAQVGSMLDAGRSLPPLALLFSDIRTRTMASDEYDDMPEADTMFLNINAESDLKAATRIRKAE